MELSRNRKILVVAFGVMAVFGFLLTPAGLETRSPSTLRSYALIPIFLATVILWHRFLCPHFHETPNRDDSREHRGHLVYLLGSRRSSRDLLPGSARTSSNKSE